MRIAFYPLVIRAELGDRRVLKFISFELVLTIYSKYSLDFISIYEFQIESITGLGAAVLAPSVWALNGLAPAVLAPVVWAATA